MLVRWWESDWRYEMCHVRHRIVSPASHRMNILPVPSWYKWHGLPLPRKVAGKVMELVLNVAAMHPRCNFVVHHLSACSFLRLRYVPLVIVRGAQALVVIVVLVTAAFAAWTMPFLHLNAFCCGPYDAFGYDVVGGPDLLDPEVICWCIEVYRLQIWIQLVAMLLRTHSACKHASISLQASWTGNWEGVFDIVEVLFAEIAGCSSGATVAAEILVVFARRIIGKVFEAHGRNNE